MAPAGESCNLSAVARNSLSPGDLDIGALVNCLSLQPLCRISEPESVRSAAPGRTCCAPLVLPFIFLKKRNIDSPDNHRTVRFERTRRINEVTPNHVPSRMIVVGLKGPRTLACLALKRLLRARIRSASAFLQIGEPLLSDIDVPALFIDATCVEGLRRVNPKQRAENVCLLQINLDEFSKLALDILYCFPDGCMRESGGKLDRGIEIIFSTHPR